MLLPSHPPLQAPEPALGQALASPASACQAEHVRRAPQAIHDCADALRLRGVQSHCVYISCCRCLSISLLGERMPTTPQG